MRHGRYRLLMPLLLLIAAHRLLQLITVVRGKSHGLLLPAAVRRKSRRLVLLLLLLASWREDSPSALASLKVSLSFLLIVLVASGRHAVIKPR